jgi:uncharacterized protein GlcG (DUF336 family)
MSQNVTLASARTVIEAARKRAEEIGVPMCIAVVDDGAKLVAFARMDGAWLGSIDIAQDKAFTARAFDIKTKELAKLSQPGQPLFGITASNEGRVVIFAGGVPLKHDGRVEGAVGSSGGQPDQDQPSGRGPSPTARNVGPTHNLSGRGNHPPWNCIPDRRRLGARGILMSPLTQRR